MVSEREAKPVFRLKATGFPECGMVWRSIMEAHLFSPLRRQRHRCSCTVPKLERTDGDTQEEKAFQNMKTIRAQPSAATTGNLLSSKVTLMVCGLAADYMAF